MPWQSNSGGGGPWGSGGGGRGNGGGQGPWGSGGGGGRGPGGGGQPPNVEEMVRQSQEKIKNMIPGGSGGFKMYAALAALGIAAWLGIGGVYTVEPNEQGVELLFGKLYETTDPGIHYNFPAPIGEVLKPAVTDINQVEVGYRSAGGGTRTATNRDVTEESLMLTGDENIIDIQTAVFWVISDAGKYLFNTRNPDLTVKNAAEAALREVIGKTGFEYARTNGRADVTEQTKTLIQQILDDYDTGILVQNVQLQKIDPPKAVIDAFRDVQAAEADRERAENEAQAYFNEKTEKAVGLAEQILRDAEAYKEERINQATGDAQRFLSVYEEYKNAKDVTKRRIYLQTMEEIMQGMNKVLIESGQGGSGVLPYLPLNELTGRK